MTDCFSLGDIFALQATFLRAPMLSEYHFIFSSGVFFLYLILFMQVYCIFLFLCAASLFGTIVSQINEIVASQTTISKELDKILEAYFSIEPGRVPLIKRMRILVNIFQDIQAQVKN